jgi:hypothetical protein
MELVDQIREILLHDWDPIGIGDIAEAKDEYDLYIQELQTMIERHAGIDEIAGYLSWIEIQRMGFSNPHDLKISDAARKLAKLRNDGD